MKRILISLLVVTLLISTSAVGVIAKADKPSAPEFKEIEKVVFVHYKAPGKPPWAGGPKEPKEPKEAEGYKLFRGGVKWSDAALGTDGISYAINTSVPADARAEIIASFEAWDAATSKELFNNDVGTTDASGANLYDGNVVSWTDLGDTGIIAVTTFWWYTGTKELAAFDMEFNTQFPWGIDPDGETEDGYVLEGAMDIRNIATHEAGHTLVLDDLYQSQYSEMTMYGYSTEGEVKAISLEPGDIAGLQALYGS